MTRVRVSYWPVVGQVSHSSLIKCRDTPCEVLSMAVKKATGITIDAEVNGDGDTENSARELVVPDARWVEA